MPFNVVLHMAGLNARGDRLRANTTGHKRDHPLMVREYNTRPPPLVPVRLLSLPHKPALPLYLPRHLL